MKDREFEFRRKDDYKDEVIAWIKCLKERHEDILFIPNTDCIKGYYKGLVLYEKITERCRKLVRRCSDKKDKNDKHNLILEDLYAAISSMC